MTLYSYIVKNDTGFAPNPFHGFCTLACCKPKIRRAAREGDYIVGLSPKSTGNRVVYAMRVTETVDFDDYWYEERFQTKRPDFEAGGEKALGDNIYHRGPTGEWKQEKSLHSLKNGAQDWSATRVDTGGGKVVISEDFIYWGDEGPPVPENLTGLIVGRAHKSTANDPLIPDFLEWFKSQEERGCVGPPTNGLPPASNAETGDRRPRRC